MVIKTNEHIYVIVRKDLCSLSLMTHKLWKTGVNFKDHLQIPQTTLNYRK